MMPLHGTDSHTMLIRTTVVSVALQSLVARLLVAGVVGEGDLVAMRETGLQLAADLSDLGGKHLEGERMAAEVEAWWGAAAGLAGV